MSFRHLSRCATPRISSASRRHRPVQLQRYVSSTTPRAVALPLQQGLAETLKKPWSWLLPDSTAGACDCPNHIISGQEHKKGAAYPLGRERLHQALVDHFHEIEQLYRGNVEYVRNMGEQNPGLLEDLAYEGQKPPFMLIDCSDSRVNEGLIFNSKPGTMFTAGNIANMFDENDTSSNAVLAYAVGTLGVKHVVVLGHYGCGGVAASMSPLPEGWDAHVQGSDASGVPEGSDVTCLPPTPTELAVQKWIEPIRKIYETSERWEIKAHRERASRAKKGGKPERPLHMHDPAFRALVEENVKANARRVAKSKVIHDHYAKLESIPTPPPAVLTGAPTPDAVDPSDPSKPKKNPVYVHGWVYDLETGIVSDLGVSTGPPGWTTPATYSGGFPFTR
ncbi:carbonic anhydrase [Coprinopsis sp. MPI-PUGE-AT-0042]|nr:carbonic anhydrase [Coprinopsis sp. MPI-PUGE-AT-0042]